MKLEKRLSQIVLLATAVLISGCNQRILTKPQGPDFSLSFVKMHFCSGKAEIPYAAFKIVNTGTTTFDSEIYEFRDLNLDRGIYRARSGSLFHNTEDECGVGDKPGIQPGEMAYLSLGLPAERLPKCNIQVTMEFCGNANGQNACASKTIVFNQTPDAICQPPPPTQTPWPTPRPFSDFDLTIAINATKTELMAGDVITVTVTTTNTGVLGANFTYCTLRGWLDKDKTSPNDYLSEPIVEPGYQQVEMHGILPGEVQTCTFSLKASRSGLVWLEGRYGGEAIFGAGPGPIEAWVGGSSPLLEVRVK